VNERKLEEIFSMAGKIINSEIKKDRDGRSRGFGTVTFEHPMEAAQAVCILVTCAVNYLILTIYSRSNTS
jgi:RNA recognition motif-containing protein